MLLFHSTPGTNSYAIFSLGVCVQRARVSPQRIFLHTWKRREWARMHVAIRYKCDPRQVTSFAIEIPRKWLFKRGNGIWTCSRTIFPARLIGQTFFLTAQDLNDETLFGYDFDVFSPAGQVPSITPPDLNPGREP